MYCLIKVIRNGVSNGLVTKDHGRGYLSEVGGTRSEDGYTGKITKRIPWSRKCPILTLLMLTNIYLVNHHLWHMCE